MATIRVLNEGNILRIIRDRADLLVHKVQIRAVDVLQSDTVRIDIGEGALHHVYIKHADVIEPVTESAFTLCEIILTWMKELVVTGTIAGGGGGGDATAANQREQLEVMTDIVTILHSIKNISTWASPSRIDESVPDIVYYGYADPGALPDKPVWAIRRVKKEGDLFHYEWARGQQTFVNVWDQRYTLPYFLTSP